MRRASFVLSFFTFVFLICFLDSCKKSNSGESSGEDYYIRFKANGEQQVFKSQDIAQITYLASDQ